MVFGARKGGNTFPLITNTKTKLKFPKLNRGPLIIKTSGGVYIMGGGTFYIRGKRLDPTWWFPLQSPSTLTKPKRPQIEYPLTLSRIPACLRSGEAVGTQIPEQQVVVRPVGGQLVALRHQRLADSMARWPDGPMARWRWPKRVRMDMTPGIVGR